MRLQLDRLLRDALDRLADDLELEQARGQDPAIERTRDPRHGDFASNVAMRLAKAAGRPPRELATALIERLGRSPLLAKAEVAGAGFVNLTLAPQAYHEELRRMLATGERYGHSSLGEGQRVLVEYLSANPTGPLHVGHGRHAAYGASLSNILRAAGFTVDEEYYVNDAGRQMDILAVSVWLRYAGRLGHELPFPPNCYQAGYVREIAEALLRAHGDSLLGDPAAARAALEAETDDAEDRLDQLIAAVKTTLGNAGFATVFQAALKSVLDDIKQDLEEFNVRPGRWYSERTLTESGAVERALETLRQNGTVYEQDGALWFRSTAYGDDKDRVVVRDNGVTTYFASDIAYHDEKFRRGYSLLLNVLGADHHGYVPRVRAGMQAMGHPGENLEVRLVQFVVLYRGTTKVQMSTRSGEYVTLRELRNEVGNDAARFFYVSRSNDQHLEFDLELAKKQSNDNPVYYVQYAHARVASMLKRMAEQGQAMPDLDGADLTLLSSDEERALLTALSRYPEVLVTAAENRAPHHIVHYVRELAASFHTWYNAHRVLVDEAPLRAARVALALGAQRVIRNALGLLGVSAPESM